MRRIAGMIVAAVLGIAAPAGAVTFTEGQSYSAAYDFTGDSIAPPYSAAAWTVDFNSSGDRLDPGEVIRMELYDASNALILTRDYSNPLPFPINSFSNDPAPAPAQFSSMVGTVVLTAFTGSFELLGFELALKEYKSNGKGKLTTPADLTSALAPVLASVPLPPSLWMLLGAVAGFVALGRRGRADPTA